MRMRKFKVHWAVLTLLISMVVLPTGVSAATLHAIIVADTNDADIGAQKDKEAMGKLMQNIRQHACLGGQTTFIDAGPGKYDEIVSKLNGLSVGPDDVVFFYYSGHGAGSSDMRWPVLGVEGQGSPANKRLPLREVGNILKSKNPRFFIAMADACNKGQGEATRGRAPKANEPSAYRKLFLGYSGPILATSSNNGEFSFGNAQQGGLFTQQRFLTSLNKALDSSNPPDWKSIMNEAIEEINIPDHPQKKQTPDAEVQVTATKQVESCDALNISPIDDPTPDSLPTCGPVVLKRGECCQVNGKKRCMTD